MSEGQRFIFDAVVVGISLVTGFVIGRMAGVESLQDEAVRKGKAEYYLDEHNQRQWRWKP